ncbi:protein obstructor-E-like [Teleopsis dalmanni]|uniref:protein obstructor-E-like n=1 Tax=Teleopsis dalmanni TaxID=139649 RepID=UPI0018CF07E5|nr:protein obstructor-E-like [Teleopsis dalmanni]
MKFFIFACALFAAFNSLNADINICEGVSNSVFLPFLGNCSKYYICMNSVAIERTCEQGYNFDAKTQSCTYPDQAQCLPTCTKALSSFCYDRTCTKYVLCYSGVPVLRECCDGLQYNSDTDRCDFPQYVDCVDNVCTIFTDPSNITFLESKASCSKYFICMEGQAYAQNCASGLMFNSECNCCDFPSNVNCTISAVKRNIQPFSRAPPKRADIDCPKEGTHFYPHLRPESYYFCMDGRGVILDCTPGLVYDSKLETCREPQNIK